jgi:hypothetical protein
MEYAVKRYPKSDILYLESDAYVRTQARLSGARAAPTRFSAPAAAAAPDAAVAEPKTRKARRAAARAAAAAEAAAAAPEAPSDAASASKARNATARPARPGNLEARHKVCLDFIQRHGESCDPWQTPTCGADIGYVRPMECVAP